MCNASRLSVEIAQAKQKGTAMGNVKPVAFVSAGSAYPAIRRIRLGDLREALAKGYSDFLAVPTHSIFLIIIYPIAGLILLRLTFGYDMLPVIFPLVAGFALLGPLAAIGIYELSRRRERSLGFSPAASSTFDPQRLWSVASLGVVLMIVFVAWLGAAMLIYRQIFGNWMPASIMDFVGKLFSTPAGLNLILAGCGVGFLFALTAFAISVVSFPMLLDRPASVGAAILTSIRAVAANPVPMAAWGFIVAFALVIGSLPVLIGLAVVLPVLGHSTWHLYRKVVGD
jgi:uncharacterized membrane protein